MNHRTSVRLIHTIGSLMSDTGGPARSVTGLCSHLAELDMSISLLSTHVKDKCENSIMPQSAKVHVTSVPCQLYLGNHPFCLRAFGKKLTYLAEEMGCQLVHDHGVWEPLNWLTASIATKKNLKLVISPRGALESWSLKQRSGQKRLAWLLYQQHVLKRADMLHATSEGEAYTLRKLGMRQPIAVIPNGIEGLRAKTTTAQQPSMIREQKQRTLLFLSRIHPKKGLLNLVAAIKKLQLNDWEIVIAGPDSDNHWATVQTSIDAAQLQSQFSFIGPVTDDEKWDLYKSADLFVLPSYSENFGIVVVEALSCGVPVITTTQTPWRELTTYQCGWCIEPTVEALAAAIREATHLSDQQRQTMGDRGRNLVIDKYSWDSAALKMESAYRWLLGLNDRPECIVD